MRTWIRIAGTGLFCVVAVTVALYWLATYDSTSRRRPSAAGAPPSPRVASPVDVAADRPAIFEVILEGIEDGGFGTAARYMPPIKDPGSLKELAEAVRVRGRRGIADLQAKLDAKPIDASSPVERAALAVSRLKSLGLLYLYEGDFARAVTSFERALELAKGQNLAPKARTDLMALLGVTSLRQGEIANCLECLGPSSCLFPFEPSAIHRDPKGSRAAFRWFSAYLKEEPRDLRVIWLLNLAAMTLGEYPDGVPRENRIPLRPFGSAVDIGRFPNVAAAAELGSRGPNLAGGSIFDDFNGDHRPDLFATSLDVDRGASLFLNRGDGTFEDRSGRAGLDDQVYALNVRAADYDNDGDLDVLLLRGAWEWPARPSLLSNRGDGTFEDVTARAGLMEPIQSEAAAWGDYDNDGKLDLYVCGEFLAPGGTEPPKAPGDPRNRGRLYRNRGDGTFEDVAAAAGVTNERCSKGAAWGDYDGDGRLDLFVSNMGQECRLYHNEGGGKFVDVAPKLGVTGTSMSFSCWFWDYDNDGRPDIYVNDYRARVPEVIASALGMKLAGSSRPRLYRNAGPGKFVDVSVEVGLDRAIAVMGSNFGDLDNDGYLDLYLGTGDMAYSGLDRKLMFKNMAGERFEDVTTSSATGHLQKGHGVSFADYDADGDLDLFVELGGAVPGDRGYNALFRNPGHGHRWLQVKLVGTTTNRSAIGAKVRADLRGPDGSTRSIYRTVGDNSSFGGNGLVQSLGLLDAPRVEALTISWPTGGATQTFRDLAADRLIEITEGSDAVKVIDRPAPAPAPARP